MILSRKTNGQNLSTIINYAQNYMKFIDGLVLENILTMIGVDVSILNQTRNKGGD